MPIPRDEQDVLQSLSTHAEVDDETRGLVDRVLAGESTEGTIQDIRRAMETHSSRRPNRLERANWYVLDALNQITFADVWAAHIGPNTTNDVIKQTRARLQSACIELGISHALEMGT
jgi:ethanolamine ammonia-lyase small subunit